MQDAPGPTTAKSVLKDSRGGLASTQEAMHASLACAKPLPPKAALVKIILFFIVLGVTCLLLDRTISAGLRSIPVSKYGALNAAFGGKVNADILVNGSSRALVHYDPRILTERTGRSAFNLGMNGVQIDIQLAVLKTYLAHNAKPKIIIQNLEAFTFEVTKPGEIYDPGLYIPYLREPALYRALHSIDSNVLKWKYLPLYGYTVEDMRFTWIRGLLAHLRWFGPEDYFQGFNPRYRSWSEDFENFRKQVPDGVRYQIQPAGVAALEELLSLCKVQDIKAFLVFSPEYFEMQAMEKNRAAIVEQMQAIAKAQDAEFWDFSDDPICKDHKNFYNSQHLNALGAEKFSQMLGKRLADYVSGSP